MTLETPLIAIDEEPVAEQTEEVVLIVPQVALEEVKIVPPEVPAVVDPTPVTEPTETPPESSPVDEKTVITEPDMVVEKEEHWLSDLEDEHGETETLSLVQNYRKVCSQLEIVPVQYLIDHIDDETIIMENHGLGPRGTKALAEVFKVTFMHD
jgi:hypothetical protein